MLFKYFGMKLLLIGVFAILLLPTLLIFCYWIPKYKRLKLILIGELFEQLGSLIALFCLVAPKKGNFAKISLN